MNCIGKYSLLIAAILVGLSSPVLAENISFGFGTNFFKPSDGAFSTTNGASFVLKWAIDKDISFGIINEGTVLDHARTGTVGTLQVTGITLTKGVIKNVALGITLGAGVAVLTNTVTRPLVDIFGTTTLLSRKGEKVTGALNATIAARYMNTNGLNAAATAVNDLNGVNARIEVTIGF